jgi:hypothetical protein
MRARIFRVDSAYTASIRAIRSLERLDDVAVYHGSRFLMTGYLLKDLQERVPNSGSLAEGNGDL